MKRLSVPVMFFVLILGASEALAQAVNTPPLFSHGPSVQVVRVSFVKTVDEMGKEVEDTQAAVLAGGAGYSFNFNFLPVGDARWLTVGLPIYVTGVTDGGFSTALGVTFGTYNNLFSLGFTYNIINVVKGPDDTGLLIDPSKTDLAILVNFGFNFGSKSADSAGAGPGDGRGVSPPPNYVLF